MAKPVRSRESVIMEAIFNHSARFCVGTVNPLAQRHPHPAATIEGGDVLVARDDILVIGNGSRTSSQGIDFIIERLKAQKDRKRHILVQELPHSPESFIHLDMVFTFLDRGHCMVFEPLLLKPSKYQTIHILIENGRVSSIREEKCLIDACAQSRHGPDAGMLRRHSGSVVCRSGNNGTPEPIFLPWRRERWSATPAMCTPWKR